MDKLENFLKKRQNPIQSLILAAVGAVLFAFSVIAAAKPVKADYPATAGLLTLIAAVCAVIPLISFLIIVVKKTDTVRVFVISAVMLSLITTLVIPINCAPDEWTHYTNAYNYSNKLMGKGAVKNNEPITLRNCDSLFFSHNIGPEKYTEVINGFELFTDDTEEVRIIFAEVTSSPFYVYTPQIIGITLGRLAHLGAVPTYYLARLLNAAMYIIIVAVALKRIPFGKTALAIMALFPVTLQQTSSASTDPFINAMAFLVSALCLELIYNKEKISVKDTIALIVCSVILAPCKLVYFAIPFMTWLIPKNKFDKRNVRIFTKYIVPLFSVASLVLFQLHNILGYTDSQPEVTLISDVPTYSFSFIFVNPKAFLLMLIRTVKVFDFFYIESMISSPLGWLQIECSELIALIITIAFVASLIPSEKSKLTPVIRRTDRLWSLMIAGGTALLVILSMFSAWTPSDSPIILGVQGRYFLPVLPLIIPVIYSKSLSAPESLKRYALFVTVNTSMYTMLNAICTAVSI
ncbi:MAG: DUF2142 domain-containing protein [Clostridiaceae bacterium]|nr:DUF2142 domain-containing protein [Clostridiaceae bacterium]